MSNDSALLSRFRVNITRQTALATLDFLLDYETYPNEISQAVEKTIDNYLANCSLSYDRECIIIYCPNLSTGSQLATAFDAVKQMERLKLVFDSLYSTVNKIIIIIHLEDEIEPDRHIIIPISNHHLLSQEAPSP